jgi:hypothetical protein
MAFVPLPPINPLTELIPVNVGAESAGQLPEHSATDVRKDRLSTSGPPV